MESSGASFLTLLSKLQQKQLRNCCSRQSIRKEIQGRIQYDEDIDWLADYPKVCYTYKLCEVAFLLHKLNQCVHKVKKVSLRQNLEYNQRREKQLLEISESVKRALAVFHEKENREIEGLASREKRRKMLSSFEEHARAAVSFYKNNFEEFKAVRSNLITQFDTFCKDELLDVKNLLASFLYEHIHNWKRLQITR